MQQSPRKYGNSNIPFKANNENKQIHFNNHCRNHQANVNKNLKKQEARLLYSNNFFSLF